MEEPDFSLLDQFFGGIPSTESTGLPEFEPYRTARPGRPQDAAAYASSFDSEEYRYETPESNSPDSSHTPTSSVSSPSTAHSSDDDIRSLIDRIFPEKSPADRSLIVGTLTDHCEISSVAELRELTLSSHWLHVNLAAGIKLRLEHEFFQPRAEPIPHAAQPLPQAPQPIWQPSLAAHPIVFELDDAADQASKSGKPSRKKRSRAVEVEDTSDSLSSTQRHVLLEKNRRHELAAAIEELRRLVPQPLGIKATKADILSSTINYVKDITAQYNLLLDNHRSLQSNVAMLQRRVLELEQSLIAPQGPTARLASSLTPYGWPQQPQQPQGRFHPGFQMFAVFVVVFMASLPFESSTSSFIPMPSRELLSLDVLTSTAWTVLMRYLLAIALITAISLIWSMLRGPNIAPVAYQAQVKDPSIRKKILRLVEKCRAERSNDPPLAAHYASKALGLMGRLPDSAESIMGDLALRGAAVRLLCMETFFSVPQVKQLEDFDLASGELFCYIALMEQSNRHGNRDIRFQISALQFMAQLRDIIVSDPHSGFSTLASASYQFISFSLSTRSDSVIYRRLAAYAQRCLEKIRNVAAATKKNEEREEPKASNAAASPTKSQFANDELTAALSGLATDFIGRSMKLLGEQGQVTAAREEIAKFVAILDSETSSSAAAAVQFWRPKLTASLAAYDMLMGHWAMCFNRAMSILLWFRQSPALRDPESELLAALLSLTSLLKLHRIKEAQSMASAVSTSYAEFFVAHPYALVSLRRIEAWCHSRTGNLAKAVYLLEESFETLEKNVHTPHLTLEPIWFSVIAKRVIVTLVDKWTNDPHLCSSTDVLVLHKALQIADKSLILATSLLPSNPYLSPRLHLLKAKVGASMIRLVALTSRESGIAKLCEDVTGLAKTLASSVPGSIHECKKLCDSLGADYTKVYQRVEKLQVSIDSQRSQSV